MRRPAVLVGALMLAFVASACGGGGGNSSSGKGDDFVYLVPSLGSQDWLCPNCGVDAQILMQPALESLLVRNDDGTIKEGEGMLAEKWEANDDFSKYTFHLRKGVKFHGKWGEMTSADVMKSFEMSVAEDSKSTIAPFLRAFKASAPDDYTFVLEAESPQPLIVSSLTEQPNTFPIISKKYIDEVGVEAASKHPVGTGPFEFASWEPGVSISFKAVKAPWRQTPSLKTYTARAVPDASTRISMIERGEASATILPSFDMAERVDKAGLKMLDVPMARQAGIYLGGNYLKPGYPAGQSPEWNYVTNGDKAGLVREALSLAINRDEIVKFVFKSLGTSEGACAVSVFPTNPGYDESTCKTDPYDPDKAKKLLAKAGYAKPSDLKLTIDLSPGPLGWCKDVSEAVAQQWSSLGITVKTQSTEWATVLDQTAGRKNTAAFCYAAPGTSERAIGLLRYISRTTDRLNYTGESAQLDQLVNDGLTAFSAADIAAKEGAVIDYLAEFRMGLPVAYVSQTYVVAPNVKWPFKGAGMGYQPSNFELITTS